MKHKYVTNWWEDYTPTSELEKEYQEGWNDCYSDFEDELKHLRRQVTALEDLVAAKNRYEKPLPADEFNKWLEKWKPDGRP